MRGLRIADDRAVARAAHLQRHFALPFDKDALFAHGEIGPAIGCAVALRLRRIDLLEVEVLNIRSGVGEAPGHP